VRWGLNLQPLITVEHFDVMAKIMLMASIVMGLSYATEWFMSWYGGDHTDRALTAYLFTGPYAPLYYVQLFCNVFAPQAFWFAAIRRNVVAVFVIAILINIGMWIERILIIWMTLSHDYLPSMWRLFQPTPWDWLTLIGSLGLFATMYLVFVRLVPTVSMHEVKKDVIDAEAHA
jgi:molybdopterin-containing oxidoreductase family membrane subunit